MFVTDCVSESELCVLTRRRPTCRMTYNFHAHGVDAKQECCTIMVCVDSDMRSEASGRASEGCWMDVGKEKPQFRCPEHARASAA